MRNLKRLGSILLAATMMVSLCCTQAFAADGDTPVKVVKYDVFQIFTGDYANSTSTTQGAAELTGETLSNIKWGKNGTGAADTLVANEVLEELQGVTADKEQDVGDGTANRDKLAVITKYVDLTSEPFATNLTLDEVRQLEVASGYYLVQAVKDTIPDGQAYPTYTVQVLEDKIDLNPKTDTVEVTKKTQYTNVDGEPVDGKKGEAAIGDTVTFTIESKLPHNLHDYEQYYWMLTDTMSEGLTWSGEASIVSATIGTKDVKANLVVSATKNSDNKITMELTDVKALNAADDEVVKIVYTAVINDKAKLGTNENTNSVQLTYSNNPNDSSDGKKYTGKTVEGTDETKTETWLTGLTVKFATKQGTPMTGAKFTLTGDNINETVQITEKFVEDADGTYYKLTKGTYTTVAPEESTKDQYESTETKYAKKHEIITGNTTSGTTVEATIDSNGFLSIGGLKSGTYTLKNTKVPAGYNLADDITFTITFDETNLFSTTSDKVSETPAEWFYTEIEVGSGTTLPETGGTGTTMFYIGGAVLVLAGAAVLFLKLRKKDSDVAA